MEPSADAQRTVEVTPCDPTAPSEKRFLLKCAEYSVLVSSFGATIVQLNLPDKLGNVKDCVLGFDKMGGYDQDRDANPYFGCVVGRVANRIRNAKFEIDGVAT